MIKVDILILLTISLAFSTVQACFSSSSPPDPEPEPPTKPDSTLDCKPGEKSCLHGGTCYATLLGGIRITHCKCPEGYTGENCERKEGPAILANRAGLAGKDIGAIVGIVLAVIIVFLITVAVFFLVVKKKKQRNKPRYEDPYLSDPSKPAPDNFGVSRHMYPTSNNPTHHVSTNYHTQPPSGLRNNAFEHHSPPKPSIKRSDNPDNSTRHHSTLSSSSRPPSNTASAFHHNTSVQSNASNCPVAHHESTV